MNKVEKAKVAITYLESLLEVFDEDLKIDLGTRMVLINILLQLRTIVETHNFSV